MIVVDSNVLTARNLASALTPLATQLEQVDPVWIAPPLWRYEFQNILTKAIWAQQVTLGDANKVWRDVASRMLNNEHEASAELVMELAARHRITGYDANFIALAMEFDVVCVTEDRELHTKFPSIAMSMKDFMTKESGGHAVREPKTAYVTGRKRKR